MRRPPLHHHATLTVRCELLQPRQMRDRAECAHGATVSASDGASLCMSTLTGTIDSSAHIQRLTSKTGITEEKKHNAVQRARGDCVSTHQPLCKPFSRSRFRDVGCNISLQPSPLPRSQIDRLVRVDVDAQQQQSAPGSEEDLQPWRKAQILQSIRSTHWLCHASSKGGLNSCAVLAIPPSFLERGRVDVSHWKTNVLVLLNMAMFGLPPSSVSLCSRRLL